MKALTINRIELLNFLLKITGTDEIQQHPFFGNNIYFLSDEEKKEVKCEIYFTPQGTISIKGTFKEKEADEIKNQVVEFLRSKNLKINILVKTGNI